MSYTHYESEQYVFDRSLSTLYLALKLLFKSVGYFPLLFAGYWMASTVLHQQDPAVLWIGLVLLFAYGFYCSVYCLKGILLACRDAGNLLWLPILGICVACTCIVPGYFVFQTITPMLMRISAEYGNLFAWLICVGTGIYLYSRYDFLTDHAPAAARPGYWLGHQLIPTITGLRV